MKTANLIWERIAGFSPEVARTSQDHDQFSAIRRVNLGITPVLPLTGSDALVFQISTFLLFFENSLERASLKL